MAKVIIEVVLNPDLDVAKVNAGAICRGVVAFGEDELKVIFEVDTAAPMKAVEFKYLNPTDSDELTGFSFAGITSYNSGEMVVAVYFKEM
ncbi:MAG TPA: hypothetical protein HPP76_10670 [Desulfuromonadales bacterium]|nr:hypothetical protein [Desulfuromonadales bacterium]